MSISTFFSSESAFGSPVQKVAVLYVKKSRPVVGKLSPTIAFKAFDCQILPILEYESDIWYTGDDVNDLEKIHLKLIKSTLGVRKQHLHLQYMGTRDDFQSSDNT